MSIYGGEEKLIRLSEEEAQVVVGLVVVAVFIAMAFERPPDVVFLLSLVLIMLLEILTLKEVLAGFANESLITIGALFLVIGAVQKSHVMDYLARKAFGIRSSNSMGTMRMLVSMAGLSAVFNNIPLCNLMIPIVRDWARSRGIPLSYLLIPLSYTVIAGGLCTMIGTSTSLIVQGLLQEDTGYSFSFFTPGVIGVPSAALLIAYMVICAPMLLPSRSGLIREVRDKAESFIAEVQVLEGSVFIGNDIGTMLGRLGLQQDSVIKIRRLVPSADMDGSQHSKRTACTGHGERAPRGNGGDFTSLDHIDIELVGRGRNRSRAESENYTLHVNGQEEQEVGHGSRSMIADVAYVQQSRGAWGVREGSQAMDDIAVNGYRAARLSARDVVTVSGSDSDRPASFTSPGALGGDLGINEDTLSVARQRTDSHLASLNGLGDLFGTTQYRDIINPSQFDVIRSGDVVFVASAAEVVTKVLKAVGSERAGLQLLDSSVLDLPGFGSELVELTLSGQNPFIGMNMGECGTEFAGRYKVGIISTRSRSQLHTAPDEAVAEFDRDIENSEGEGGEGSSRGEPDAASVAGSGLGFLVNDTRSVVLAAGDMVLCLAKTSDIEELKGNRDFFVASTVGSVPPVMSVYGMVPVAVFVIMICAVAAEKIRMGPAALAAVAIFFVGGWLKAADVPKLVDLRLLMLMGCSISFATSMQSSGLAKTIANEVIKFIDPSPRGALYVVYLITLMVTETMSNNAAAAIMYPLASAIAKQLGVSVLPFALTVLIAATAAFMSPIGYQTHLMVWAPGGYKFIDFVKFGFLADLIFWQITCALAPVLFPL